MNERYRRDEMDRQRARERGFDPQNYPDMPRQSEQYSDYSGEQAGGYEEDYRTRLSERGGRHADDFGRDHERGFLARAGDEVASWFGDDDAARRREMDHRGHGPADYTRSDERIREDVNDRLTDDPRLDARRVTVAVADAEVTLSGAVASREAKRRAEDCVDRISGVRHVQNNLRVEDRAYSSYDQSGWSSGNARSDTGVTTSATAKHTTTSDSIDI